MRSIFFTVLALFCLKATAQTTVYANDGATTYLTTMGYVNGAFDVNGEFNVESTGDIDVTGNVDASDANSKLQMHSVSDEYSNLMIGGTTNGSATYLRYVNAFNTIPGSPTGQNDLVSAPFAGATFGAFRAYPDNVTNLAAGTIGGVPTWLFGPFDNTIANVPGTSSPYINWNATNDAEVLTAGVGYRTGSIGGAPITFTGNMEVGTVNVPISVGLVTWNLVGNPYSTYIDSGDFITANTAALDPNGVAIYGYDGTAAGGEADWTIINMLNEATYDLTPGQGFMVAAAGTGTITFTPAMRTMGVSTDDFIVGRTVENTFFKLNMAGNNGQYRTEFYFTPNTTRSLDPGYDAQVYSLGSDSNTAYLYSHLVENNNNVPFAIQALSALDYQEDVLIALGVVAQAGENLTFSISETTLPTGSSVFLYDMDSNTVTDITGTDYTVQLSEALNGTGRFYINFQNTTLSTIDNNMNVLDFFVNQSERQLVLSGNINQNADINVYDIQGRLVSQNNMYIDANRQNIDLSYLSSGVYIAKVTSEDDNIVEVKKFILK